MAISVANEYKWPPQVIGGLFIDRQDMYGLKFWYDEAKRESDKIKQKEAHAKAAAEASRGRR